MFDLLRCLPDGEQRFCFDGVLKSLAAEANDWDTLQRFGIATLLAKDGDAGARRAMYSSYRDNSWQVDDFFVELDRIDGFLFVAEQSGALSSSGDDQRESAVDFFERSMEVCGEATLRHAFENAASGNPQIAAFRRLVQDYERRPSIRPPRPTNDELLAAARSLPDVGDTTELIRVLRLIGWRKISLDPGTLLPMLDLPMERVRWAALGALANTRDPRARAVAFDPVYRERAPDLLVENYEPGDEEVVAGWVRDSRDPEERHGLQICALSFFDAHPRPEVEVPVWELLYNEGVCGFCRGSVVRRLMKLDALRDELRAECEWDSVLDTRELVRM